MNKQKFDRTSSIGTVCTLTKNDDLETAVIKLPQGVLIRTTFQSGSYDGGSSVYTRTTVITS